MTPRDKITQRLEKLERQKSYIKGMRLAEYAHEHGISEKEAMELSREPGERYPALLRKGYRTQRRAIEKRKALEDLEQSENLFSAAGG